MKYRQLTDLTDEEIRFIVKDILKPKDIWSIERDCEDNEITCNIVSDWGLPEDMFEIEEEVTISQSGIQVDFVVSDEEQHRYQQYLLAKRCHSLQKDNPYL